MTPVAPTSPVILTGISEEEMKQVTILGQMILRIASGQPMGRMMNACLWLQWMLAREDIEVAEASVGPIRGLADTLQEAINTARLVAAPPPPPGTPLH